MCFFAVLHVLASLHLYFTPPSHPRLSAWSHPSSTSMHFSSGHNGDHMFKPTLKPNTGHRAWNKSCCQQQGRALPTGNQSAPASASPARHSVETGGQYRWRGHMFCRFLEVSGTAGFWLLFPLWDVHNQCLQLRITENYNTPQPRNTFNK